MESTNTSLVWTQVAEIELIYRTTVKASQRPIIHCSADLFTLLQQLWNSDRMDLQEEFKVLLLNNGNRVLGVFNASCGGMTGTIVDIRLILVAALKAGASKLVACHNHPSGSLRPSKADLATTGKLKAAAKLLDIDLLDHLIITTEGYYSFADEGVL